MKAKILKLEQKLFDGEVTKVILPAVNGEMCILPDHISIITNLRKGSIKVFKKDTERPLVLEVQNGVCSFSDNLATVIVS